MNLTKVPAQFPYSPNYAFILSVEKNHDAPANRLWMSRNWTISFYIAFAYLCLILAGKKYMRDKSPFGVRSALVVWNLSLALFSFMGTYRTLPELVHVLRHYGLYHSICVNSYVEDNIVLFWAWLFVASKALELLDTAFVVAKKQKLNLIHWFHHAVTLCICWGVYHESPAMARYMITVNYSIHTVMYVYYALRALRISIPKIFAMIITTSQIMQMAFGLGAAIYSALDLAAGGDCQNTPRCLKGIFFGYGSFFALFVNFFIKTYVIGGKTKKLS